MSSRFGFSQRTSAGPVSNGADALIAVIPVNETKIAPARSSACPYRQQARAIVQMYILLGL
jgi:hypothetical protein